MAEPYAPQDRLFLWWLDDPAQPRPVEELGLAAGGRVVSLRYSPEWLRSGVVLSADLPLMGDPFVPLVKRRLAAMPSAGVKRVHWANSTTTTP